MEHDRREELRKIFLAAVSRVNPQSMITERMSVTGESLSVATGADQFQVHLAKFDRIMVLGAGKAAAKMAAGVKTVLGNRITGGLIAVKDSHAENLGNIRTIVAGHPVPDAASMDAANEVAALADGADERTLFITLISGGGSALLCSPMAADGFSLNLEEKQEVTRLLLACGATIQEVNCVRKHLSGIKGGRLAERAYPATSVNLILSDVVGDDLDAIASGLMVPDGTTFADAMRIIERFGIRDRLPRSALQIIEGGMAGKVPDTPKTGNQVFDNVTNLIIGSNAQALDAARSAAQQLGYDVTLLSSQITGEAREIARFYLGIGKDIRKRSMLASPPACIIAGGETTVTIRGTGKGGRNQEMALSFLREIEKQPADSEGLYFLSAGTDGGDGPTDAAGAFASREILEEAIVSRLSPGEYLERNDAYTFFAALGGPTGGLLKTGPTDTNVCDIQILLLP